MDCFKGLSFLHAEAIELVFGGGAGNVKEIDILANIWNSWILQLLLCQNLKNRLAWPIIL